MGLHLFWTKKDIISSLAFCTYFLNLPIYRQSSEMTTYGIAKRIRHKHLPYLHQPPRWGRAGWQIGFSHFRHHNVTPSHCSIHYALPWEWGEVHAENQGRKWPPARRGKMASVIIPVPSPGGIGLNIDMQHYKTRLLSGCRVTASWLSLPWHTHTQW